MNNITGRKYIFALFCVSSAALFSACGGISNKNTATLVNAEAPNNSMVEDVGLGLVVPSLSAKITHDFDYQLKRDRSMTVEQNPVGGVTAYLSANFTIDSNCQPGVFDERGKYYRFSMRSWTQNGELLPVKASARILQNLTASGQFPGNVLVSAVRAKPSMDGTTVDVQFCRTGGGLFHTFARQFEIKLSPVVPTISASPALVPVALGGVSSTKIKVSAGRPGDFTTTVNCNKGAGEQIFGKGAEFSMEAPWISEDSVCDFRLRQGSETGAVLSQVRVSGTKMISASPDVVTVPGDLGSTTISVNVGRAGDFYTTVNCHEGNGEQLFGRGSSYKQVAPWIRGTSVCEFSLREGSVESNPLSKVIVRGADALPISAFPSYTSVENGKLGAAKIVVKAGQPGDYWTTVNCNQGAGEQVFADGVLEILP
ncbi:hypothetical protein EBR21_16290, partial [bacterium]|nr:hypothetical protein [bacterium]